MISQYRYLSYRYRKLRKKIIERDSSTCQACGVYGNPNQNKKLNLPRLVVHHIVPLNSYGDDSENNLLTLCSKCHTKAHHKRQ